jgi:Cu(I)/Ag(I) efflux system periplasmic protein CusF
MRILVSAGLIVLATIGTLPAQAAGEHAGHSMASHGAGRNQAMVDGTVKKVDKAGGKVTLAHGPLTNLDMPAMTMAFKVKEAAWLERMKPGQKIRFMADNVDGAMMVTHLEAAK